MHHTCSVMMLYPSVGKEQHVVAIWHSPGRSGNHRMLEALMQRCWRGGVRTHARAQVHILCMRGRGHHPQGAPEAAQHGCTVHHPQNARSTHAGATRTCKRKHVNTCTHCACRGGGAIRRAHSEQQNRLHGVHCPNESSTYRKGAHSRVLRARQTRARC